MMGKCLLIIDNRPFRAENMMSEDRWKELQSMPNLDSVEKMPEEDLLEKYDVVAIHRTYIIENRLEDRLEKLIRSKYVILFSGGISTVNITREGRLLTIPVERFYSPQLAPFCTYLDDFSDSSEEPVRLAALLYGKDHWKLPALMRLRDLQWQYPEGQRPNSIKRDIEELRFSLSLSEGYDLNGLIENELLTL